MDSYADNGEEHVFIGPKCAKRRYSKSTRGASDKRWCCGTQRLTKQSVATDTVTHHEYRLRLV